MTETPTIAAECRILGYPSGRSTLHKGTVDSLGVLAGEDVIYVTWDDPRPGAEGSKSWVDTIQRGQIRAVIP